MSELPALSDWEAGRVLPPLNDPLCLLGLAHWCFVTAAAETHTSSGSVQSKPSMALSFSRKPWSPKASEILFSPHPVTLRFGKKQDPRDLRVKSTHRTPQLSVHLGCWHVCFYRILLTFSATLLSASRAQGSRDHPGSGHWGHPPANS